MFNKDFYPTPVDVIERMLVGVDVRNKVILEPSAGKGDIVDYVNKAGAKEVLTCEVEPELTVILQSKSTYLKSDFLMLTAAEISHIDMIIMNPPFSADEQHILHAWDIAPDGCTIISLLNHQTYDNAMNRGRRAMKNLVGGFGFYENLGDAFRSSERKTKVEVGLLRLFKPGEKNDTEFEGFFMEDEPEEANGPGLMPYNKVRDTVARYVQAVKLYDSVLWNGVEMRKIIEPFMSIYGEEKLVFTLTDKAAPNARETFKKDLQKRAWKYILYAENMRKYLNSKAIEEINAFVEKQSNVPFTMRNVYQMMAVIVGTHGSRMEKVIEDAFDNITQYHKENQYKPKGWKTNSHYMVGKKFILPNQFELSYSGNLEVRTSYYRGNKIEDLASVLTYITGIKHEHTEKMYDAKTVKYIDKIVETEFRDAVKGKKLDSGEKFDWGFFTVKAYKVGTGHFEFKDDNVWMMFNQAVAKIKGYPLPASMSDSAYKTDTKENFDGTNNAAPKGTVQVIHNKNQRGIEVKFGYKPTEKEREFLKSSGFKYSSKKNLWYAKHSETLFAATKSNFIPETAASKQSDTPPPPPQEKVVSGADALRIAREKLQAKMNKYNRY